MNTLANTLNRENFVRKGKIFGRKETDRRAVTLDPEKAEMNQKIMTLVRPRKMKPFFRRKHILVHPLWQTNALFANFDSYDEVILKIRMFFYFVEEFGNETFTG